MFPLLLGTLWFSSAWYRSERTSRKAWAFWERLETVQRDWSCPLCGCLCSFFGVACGSTAHEMPGSGLEGKRKAFFSNSFFLTLQSNRKKKKPKMTQETFILFYFFDSSSMKPVCGAAPWRVHNSLFSYESEWYCELKPCYWSLLCGAGLIHSCFVKEAVLVNLCQTVKRKPLIRFEIRHQSSHCTSTAGEICMDNQNLVCHEKIQHPAKSYLSVVLRKAKRQH